MPRLRDEQQILWELDRLHAYERGLWASRKWINVSIAEQKRELLLNYLGKRLDDVAYNTFVKRVEQDEELSKLLDDIVKKVPSADFASSTFANAFYNAFMPAEKDEDSVEACRVLVDDIYNIISFGNEEVLNSEPNVKWFINRKEENVKKNNEMQLNNLKLKVYDEANPDPFSINWGSPSVSMDEYKAAASIIIDKSLDVDKTGCIYDACLSERKKIDRQITSLASSIDFKGYVMETLSKNDPSLFEKAEFINGWNLYKIKVKSAREVPFDKTLFGIAIDIEDDDSLTTKDEAKETVKKMIIDIDKNNRVFKQTDCILACDFVIASIFAGVDYDKTVMDSKFGPNTGAPTSSNIFNSVLNTQVNNMRDAIMKDPVFHKVLAQRVDVSSFYGTYRYEVNKEMNRKIKAEKDIEKRYKNNFSKSTQHKKYASETDITLSVEDKLAIVNVRDYIERINVGKSPSKLMKKLTESLDKVAGKDIVNYADLEALHKAGLGYYKERQGTVFSPFTDNGKARLSQVENLLRVTDKIIVEQRKIEQESIHKAPRGEAPIEKPAGKGMGM